MVGNEQIRIYKRSLVIDHNHHRYFDEYFNQLQNADQVPDLIPTSSLVCFFLF